MKRILLVNYSMEMGGIESMIWNFCIYYKQKNYDVDVLTFKSAGVFIKKIEDLGINVYVISKNEGLDFSLIRRLVKFIGKEDYDVIHTNNYSTWLYIVLASIFSRNNSRIIHTEHSLVSANVKRRLLIERVLSFFTYKIVTVSGDVKRCLESLGRIRGSRIDVIYNGINTKKFSHSLELRAKIRAEYGISEKTKVVGAIGRLVEVKDHESLILSFSKVLLNEPDSLLVIIGDGVLNDHLNDLVLRCGMEEKVLLLGQKDNIHEYLNMFDIYIMTSLSEGFSIGLLEAMSSELPVIVTKVGGNIEIIDDNRNGILIEPKNIENISTSIIKLMNDDNKMKYLAGNAREYVVRNYNELDMYKQYERLYFEK